jgi:hypothetical protein
MAWEDWTKTAVEKAREHIVLAVFGLIVLLLLIIWQAVPASVWGTVSEAVPKRVLWALLGLATITICLLIALLIDKNRTIRRISNTQKPPESRFFKIYGLLWDKDLNPHCPADKVLLTYFMKLSSDHYDVLRCAKCNSYFRIHHETNGDLTLAKAKDSIRAEQLKA